MEKRTGIDGVKWRTLQKKERALVEEMRVEFRATGRSWPVAWLPTFPPRGPAEVVLVTMEPSLRGWADDEAEAELRVREGFHNFMYSCDDFLLHYAMAEYLRLPAHLTDLSKAAMKAGDAAKVRSRSYDLWLPLLKEELDLACAPGSTILPVGGHVERFLRKNLEGYRIERPLLHYSGQAAACRWIVPTLPEHRDSFAAFSGIDHGAAIVGHADRYLRERRVPDPLREGTLDDLLRRKCPRISPSRVALLYTYKVRFEELAARLRGRVARTSSPS